MRRGRASGQGVGAVASGPLRRGRASGQGIGAWIRRAWGGTRSWSTQHSTALPPRDPHAQKGGRGSGWPVAALAGEEEAGGSFSARAVMRWSASAVVKSGGKDEEPISFAS